MPTNTTKQDKLSNSTSPFFSLLADAEAIQVREVSPTTQPAIVRSVEEAIRVFENTPEATETRSFLVTVKNPPTKPKERIAPAAETQPDTAHILRQANLLLENGDSLLARNLYSYVLRGNIRDKAALKGLGLCLMNVADIISAKKCFNALVEIHSSLEGRALLGICCVHENNDKAAQEHFNKVSEPELLPPPLRFDFFKEFGNCLTRLGRLNEAFISYRSALELNPHSDAIHVNLGTLEMQRHQFDLATNYFQKAIELCPANSKAHCGVGIVAQVKGEKKVAETYFEKSLDLDCQNIIALLQLIALANCAFDWKRVKTRLVRFLLKDPNHLEMRFILASTLFKENDWLACEKELDFILIKNPGHEKARKLKNDLSLHKHGYGGRS